MRPFCWMLAAVWPALLWLQPMAWAAPEQPKTEQTATKTQTARVVVGESQEYEPLAKLTYRGMLFELPASVAARLEGLGSYPVDLDRTTGENTSLETGAAGNFQARVGLKFNSVRALIPFNIAAEYEHDVITGPVGGEPEIAGEGYPNSEALEHQLRKGYGRVSLGYFLHLSGGLMMSHWGLGLMSNDGAHGWAPGSAAFADPRGGDRVLRVVLASGPVTRLGLFGAVGYDWVQGDDVMLEDDKARQLIGAFAIGRGLPTTIGFYAVWRTQEARDGDITEVAAMDFHARTSHALTERLRLTAEMEAALIVGKTDLASSPDFPQKDVLQLGVAVRASLEYAGRLGGVLDFLYASGDSNFDDGSQNGYKPDPNYEMGLMLYRHVLAGQTGRAAHTAADPNLSGVPNEDLDRFATRGSPTNTVAFFPRAWWRPLVGLEVYGGPLFAFTASDNADPLNTKLAGGMPRNALDGEPGRYLGTELDIGARFQTLAWGTLLMVGVEGGMLIPGSALQRQGGKEMGSVLGGRFLLGYNF
jgi:hypothetical protein